MNSIHETRRSLIVLVMQQYLYILGTPSCHRAEILTKTDFWDDDKFKIFSKDPAACKSCSDRRFSVLVGTKVFAYSVLSSPGRNIIDQKARLTFRADHTFLNMALPVKYVLLGQRGSTLVVRTQQLPCQPQKGANRSRPRSGLTNVPFGQVYAMHIYI